ncbi:hypothetical protein ACSRUE_46685 [Sorangium sp. KYC3313]|uniref:hypothetical protein n=1 Tax=Sorangium sp. KYC3313 TaxID=3449740 RepID=UPI003F8CB76B
MTVRPDRTVSHGRADAGHHRFEDRHGGPDGSRHQLEVDRLDRLVRAAQEIAGQAERREREKRSDAGQEAKPGDGGVKSRPAPRNPSIADLERADNEGMLPPGET